MSYKTEGRQTVVRLFLILHFITLCFWLLTLMHWSRNSTQIQTESPEGVCFCN